MSLTETAIKAAKPAEKPYKLSDERGLYLLVRPGAVAFGASHKELPDGKNSWRSARNVHFIAGLKPS